MHRARGRDVEVGAVARALQRAASTSWTPEEVQGVAHQVEQEGHGPHHHDLWRQLCGWALQLRLPRLQHHSGIAWITGSTTGCLKSHYVAKVDYDECNGCGVCVQRCQFGAIKFEVTQGKTNIDHMRCFGCGLCETGCPSGRHRSSSTGRACRGSGRCGDELLQAYPTIEIDSLPSVRFRFACKKCLEVCPQAVFFTFGIKHERGREIDPNDPGAYGLAVVVPGQVHGV